jgi:hypothetical protein
MYSFFSFANTFFYHEDVRALFLSVLSLKIGSVLQTKQKDYDFPLRKLIASSDPLFLSSDYKSQSMHLFLPVLISLPLLGTLAVFIDSLKISSFWISW